MKQGFAIKIDSFRFGWLEYYLKKNITELILQYTFGILFLHSREIAYYLFSKLNFQNSEKILDIGSGDGIFANWISYKVGCSVLGVEKLKTRTEKSIKVSKRYHLNTKFINNEFEKISLENDSFDKILLVDSLEHLEEPRLVLKRCLKLLKNKGVLVISTPSRNQGRVFLKSYKDFFDYGQDEHHTEGFSAMLIERWLKAANPKVKIQARLIYYKLYQIAWEVSEFIRVKNKFLYSLFVPPLSLLALLDRYIKIGKKGNGLIIIAQKI